jgi:hypothetical protein
MFPAFSTSDLLSTDGFQVHFNNMVVYFKSHYQHDPLARVLGDNVYCGPEPYYPLQLMHLMASAEDRPGLEVLMAAYASKMVANSEHLLAMDMTVDYRGDYWTPKEFNADAYEIGLLFHRKKVDPRLFLPFVKKSVVFKEKDMIRLKRMDGNAMRKFAMTRVLRHKIYSDIAKKLGVPKESIREAMALAPDGLQGSSLLEKISEDKFARNKHSILKAVGVSEDWKLLATAIRCFPKMEVQFLRSFLVGKLQDCGKPPLEMLRAIEMWG